MSKPIVAVVGRPNVGKSTLVNRFTGARNAIVQEEPGVTRDRNEFSVEWAGREFTVIDTGGWLPTKEELDRKVSKQSEHALKDADIALLVVDVTVGITEEDDRIADLMRKLGTKTIVVANKVDGVNRESDVHQFASLGLGWPMGVSALHGRESGDLLDAIVAAFPAEDPAQEVVSDSLFSVAVVGRPNVGKSTLFNRLVGEDRSVVHDQPGTTRDAIDTIVETINGPIRFVDTAGMRRRAKVEEETEYYSMVRALQAVDKADAALLIIDASLGITNQDQRLAERIDAAGTAIVIVLNKWDLMDAESRAGVTQQLKQELGFLDYAPRLKVSALTGKGVHQLLPALQETRNAYEQRIPTAVLNKVLREAQANQPPPSAGHHRSRILYATQGAANPPTFTIFATHRLQQTYLRYLEHKMRDAFDLGATPVKLRVRLRNE